MSARHLRSWQGARCTFSSDTVVRVKVGADTQDFNRFGVVTFFDNIVIVVTVRR